MSLFGRLVAMSNRQRDDFISTLVAGNRNYIVEDDEFARCARSMDSDSWVVDEHEADEPDFDDDAREVRIPLTYDASCVELDEYFERIVGSAVVVVHDDGHVTMEEVTAERAYSMPE